MGRLKRALNQAALAICDATSSDAGSPSAPATFRRSRSNCSAPARASRRRWSARWRISPPSRAFRVAGPKAFAEAGITHNDVDRLMIYDVLRASADLGLEDLGLVPRGEVGAFIAGHNTARGGKLPLNTNGMHSGMYALQESVRQMRGTAPAQIPDAKISVCHGVGGMFAASGTIIMSNEPP
jgi:hypothetical protein